MKELWDRAFLSPLEEIFTQVRQFLPHLLAMLVIVALGVVIAWAVAAVISRLLAMARFDQFTRRIGFAEELNKSGIKDRPSHLIGRIVYWVIFLVFFMLGLGALQLTLVDQFVANALSYTPHFIVAFLIIAAGVIIADFLSSATLIAAVNAQFTQARLLARVVRVGVILFALAMAFEQLGIATSIIVAAFSIAFGGFVLALAIAFGLGAKDVAREMIEKRVKQEQEPKEEEFSHL